MVLVKNLLLIITIRILFVPQIFIAEPAFPADNSFIQKNGINKFDSHGRLQAPQNHVPAKNCFPMIVFKIGWGVDL